MTMPRWRTNLPPTTPMSKLIAARKKKPYCFGNWRTPAIVCPKCPWLDDCKTARAEKEKEKAK